MKYNIRTNEILYIYDVNLSAQLFVIENFTVEKAKSHYSTYGHFIFELENTNIYIYILKVRIYTAFAGNSASKIISQSTQRHFLIEVNLGLSLLAIQSIYLPVLSYIYIDLYAVDIILCVLRNVTSSKGDNRECFCFEVYSV